MAVEGTLEVFKLPEILQMISQQRKTGILTVQGQQDIIAVSFLRGEIVTVDSLNQTQEEGLSQILVSEGLLSSGQFARAASEHQSSGTRMLDLLVDRDYVKRDALLRALRLHAARLLEQLLAWEKGEFKFYSGEEVPYEEGFVPLTVEEILAASGIGGIGGTGGIGAAATRRATGPVPVPASSALSMAESVSSPSPAVRPGLRVVRKEGVPDRRPALVAVPPPGAEDLDATTMGSYRRMRVETPPEEVRRPLLVKLAAAGLAALVFAILFLAPSAIVTPFPWQEEERHELAREQRASLYLKIDRAAKTWFLLEGRFPERLGQLVEAGFLAPDDLNDPQGNPFQYSATEESYTLQPMKAGKPVQNAETTEAITGNFLLDPGFLTMPEESAAQPLVLLD